MKVWFFLGWLCLTFAQARAATCGELKGHPVAAATIGLPTRGATVLKTKRQDGFCEVSGEIRAVDPAAMPIRFAVELPDTWNGKAVQFGGGAFDGYIPDVRGATVLGDTRGPTPLQRGFATFGSDSGHHHHYLLLPDRFNALSAKFAQNDEQRKNFAGDSLKKTHDVAVALMQARYGSKPQRMYFVGGSTGGREALMVVNRWPADYDGVLAAYAAWNQIESDLQFIRISQALYNKGPDGQSGWLPGSRTRLLQNAVLNACDAADGLKDGIVSNPAACRFNAETLRCANGKNGRGCLSAGQERTVAAYAEPQVSDFAVKNGMTMEPGFNVLRGADIASSTGLFRHAFKPALPLLNSFFYLVGDQVLRNFLSDGHFDTMGFNTRTGFASDGKNWVAAIQKQSDEDDASLADLSVYASHGGKLLLVHGDADTTIPTEASVYLYHRIVTAMGQANADSFLRLYLVPGMGHGRGDFNAGFDTVGVLDAWSGGGSAPGGLVVADQNKHASRTRPLCAYPRWPRYTGGDELSAQSFSCAER